MRVMTLFSFFVLSVIYLLSLFLFLFEEKVTKYTCLNATACVWVTSVSYLQSCAEQMPLAWRGLAGCQVRRLAAVVCVCSACGGGRTVARELGCGQPQRDRAGERERDRSHQGASHSLSFINPGWERGANWNIYSPALMTDRTEIDGYEKKSMWVLVMD